jgi:type 1 glutamine amidotransferase
MVNDEQHFVTYDNDPKHVILESENVDVLEYEDHGKKSVAGWAYEHGKGRVVFTAVGHQPRHVGSRVLRAAEKGCSVVAETDLASLREGHHDTNHRNLAR